MCVRLNPLLYCVFQSQYCSLLSFVAIGHFLICANTNEVKATFSVVDTSLMKQDGFFKPF